MHNCKSSDAIHEAVSEAANLPETQTLMAAVIRLLAKTAERPNVPQLRTLLALLGELRGHPGLLRQPAVLAGLAEAHALMVERLSQVALAEACPAEISSPDGDERQLH